MSDTALTPKQAVVAKHMSGGKSVVQTAKAMKINPQGVYGHVRRIKEAGLGHLLEPGAVEALEEGVVASNGSPEINDAVSGRIEQLVKDAIKLAETRLAEIATRRNGLENQITNLKVEDEALETEAVHLSDERDRLSTTS